jgi:uncharacterized phage protein (TIGR01671 family)
MKRKIKFRVWDYKNEVMYNPEDIGIKPLTDRTSQLTISSEGIFIRPDNEMFELMQFTGLYDVNGKEIYEGDILGNDFIRAEVIFEDGAFQLKTNIYQGTSHLSQMRSEKLKKEGNRFDNPELLKL